MHRQSAEGSSLFCPRCPTYIIGSWSMCRAIFWCSWIWSKMPADVTRGRKPGNRPIYITSFYPLFYTLILKLLRLVSSMFWPGVADENFAVRNEARWCVMGGEFCLPYCCPCQYVNSANGGISGISGMDVFQQEHTYPHFIHQSRSPTIHPQKKKNNFHKNMFKKNNF